MHRNWFHMGNKWFHSKNHSRVHFSGIRLRARGIVVRGNIVPGWHAMQPEWRRSFFGMPALPGTMRWGAPWARF